MSYSSINRAVLVGRLTRDPELRALPSGVAVCKLRLACDSVRKTPQGAYEEKPNFFNVSVYGAQAETVGRYMSKGRKVAVDGRLDWHEWDTPEGEHCEAVEVLADRVEFLEGRGGEAADGPADGSAADSPAADSPAAEGSAAEGERVGDLVF